MNIEQQTLYYLFVALAIGLLIGIERGWKERRADEGERVAGVRTYGLIGLLGGSGALLAEQLGSLALGLMFIGLAGALTAVYISNLRSRNDVGITSLVAGLLTFMLGALAVSGEVALAAATAVITTLLLSYKPTLHRWVQALEARELRAGIKLLLISVVLLPILPNKGYGPWQVLNPYVIWWMVVLIAAISFVGYFAVKIGGARRGTVFTGLFGGLASSTAVTLHFSRLARSNRNMNPVLASGILLANGTMFPRMLLLVSLINPALFIPLLPVTLVMALCSYLPALYFWRSQAHGKTDTSAVLKNPLELGTALLFGLLLVFVMLLGKALQNSFGEAGLLALAAASGLADVDAINLSLARMSQQDLAIPVAVLGIVIAAAVNSLSKAGMAAVIGGRGLMLRVSLPLLASALGGLLTVWLAWYSP
jgi:uncharacterized membrane protein (DUF4010 family)